MRNRIARTGRHGFVLPYVVVVTLLVSILSLGAVTVAWRGHRAARLGAGGVRAQLAADEGLALQLDRWPRDSLAALPLGHTLRTTVVTAIGDPVRSDITRTHPLMAWTRARVLLDRIGTPGGVQRVVQRVVWLDPPAVPLPAAVTVLGAARGQGPSEISGADLPSGAGDCGSPRDSASVAALVASALTEGPTATWDLRPAWHAPADNVALRAQFERAWPALVAASRVVPHDSTTATVALLPGWHSLLLVGTPVVTQGPARWRGLLSIAGDLIVRHTLEVDGLLVVRGHLDVRAGSLRVRGAVLVAPSGAASTPSEGEQAAAELGGHTAVHYDRCAVQMALATVADPRVVPFLSWLEPPP
ncbi:MAG: hypothetical protein P3C10_10320 [Gemmatimonadota bacterium]|nr:hypothetical protein [Gemmatimonadota bacterium]